MIRTNVKAKLDKFTRQATALGAATGHGLLSEKPKAEVTDKTMASKRRGQRLDRGQLRLAHVPSRARQ